MVCACERVLSSHAEAEDCASEALLAVLERGGLDKVDNEEAWLVRIAKRRAIDAVRRDVRGRRRALRLAVQADPQAAADIAEAVVEQAEARWLSRTAQEVLPETSAQVLAAVADGHTIAEAADRLGMTKRAAESHLHRARAALRAALSATLGLLAALGWTLRRAAHGAPVAVLAAATAFLVAPQLIVSQPVPAGIAPERSFSRPAVAVTQRPGSPAPPRHVVRVRPASARPAHGTNAQGNTRTVAGAVVLRTQYRSSPDDPVGGVLWCAKHLVVSTKHVGC
jgi:RNA polymerase sigma-70 factor (ECF subfamily)